MVTVTVPGPRYKEKTILKSNPDSVSPVGIQGFYPETRVTVLRVFRTETHETGGGSGCLPIKPVYAGPNPQIAISCNAQRIDVPGAFDAGGIRKQGPEIIGQRKPYHSSPVSTYPQVTCPVLENIQDNIQIHGRIVIKRGDKGDTLSGFFTDVEAV